MFMKYVFKRIFRLFGFDIVSNYQLNRSDPFFHIKYLLNDVNVETIFDVGAAVGEFSIKFSKIYIGSKIHSFEPQPDFFSTLKSNSRNRWISNMLALSNRKENSTFYLTYGRKSSSLIHPNVTNSGWDSYLGVSDTIIVETDTIQNYCTQNSIERINLLKIDAQGSELNILKGAERMLSGGNIDVIYTEVLFMRFYKDQPLFHDIAVFLEMYNYKLYNIYNHVYTKNSILTWADAIFVHNDILQAKFKINV